LGHHDLALYEIKSAMTANRNYLDTMQKFAAKNTASCSVNVVYRGQDLLSTKGPSFINWQSL
jgi:hypothetical protein